MAERRSSHPRRHVRRWSLIAGLLIVLVGGAVVAKVVSDRGSAAPKRRTTATTRSTTPPSTAPGAAASCGRGKAVAAPAPSGGDNPHRRTAFFTALPKDPCVASPAATYRLDGTLRISAKTGLEI